MCAIDSVEFTDWMAYYRIEPFGERLADVRMGMIASTIANTTRDTKKVRKPFQPIDFMPWVEEKKNTVLFKDPKDQAKLVALSVFGFNLDEVKAGGKPFVIKRKSRG